MKYSTATDRLLPTWSLATGTARSGYGVANLGDGDPSNPLWINESTLRVVGDLGSAQEIVAVFLFAHTFQQGLGVRVQANAVNVWTSPTLSVAIPILAPYNNGFTCHAMVDLRTSLPSAGARTFQFLSIANVDGSNVAAPNNRTVAIGEVWVVSAFQQLLPKDLAHDYSLPQGQLVAPPLRSHRGAQTTYDLGSRERGVTATCRALTATGLDTVLDWVNTQHGSALPMVTVLDVASTSRRLSEPWLSRFKDAQVTPVSSVHKVYYVVALNFEEVGQGEPVNA